MKIAEGGSGTITVKVFSDKATTTPITVTFKTLNPDITFTNQSATSGMNGDTITVTANVNSYQSNGYDVIGVVAAYGGLSNVWYVALGE